MHAGIIMGYHKIERQRRQLTDSKIKTIQAAIHLLSIDSNMSQSHWSDRDSMIYYSHDFSQANKNCPQRCV